MVSTRFTSLTRALARRSRIAAVAATLVLAACGGGGGGGSGGGATSTASAPDAPGGGALVTAPTTKSDASRFLAQASFGPTATEIDRVMAIGYDAWLADQMARAPAQTHTANYDERYAAANNQHNADYVHNGFWKQALAGPDALGQRVAFALSQVFVVSLVDGSVSQYPRGVASYLDMLRRNAFGNYRQLIEDVALHPMMGLYLSHLRNQGQAGRVPDENFAREVMQLFSIGLYELNPDGTPRLGADGKPIETYTNDDVTGLAKVFTGWSWYGSDVTDDYFRGNTTVKDREITPMMAYDSYHSKTQKTFLKTTCPGGTLAAQSLKCALDALFAHPNVGPFIGRQLIQRLVTSNPSPSYVARVASAFADNGSGVRGDLRAVVRAVLLDPEARLVATAGTDKVGKVREPVLRMAAFLRAFDATSASGRFLVGNTDDPSYSLGQTAMRSASVFNFYRPGYVPPTSELATAGLVAPELQIVNETSIAGYLNAMMGAVQNGVGSNSDVKADYTDELALAGDADALLDRLNLLLANGQLSSATRTRIRDVLNSISISAVNASAAATARLTRVRVAVYLVLASPEFIVQK